MTYAQQQIERILDAAQNLDNEGVCCELQGYLDELISYASTFADEMNVCENCGRIISYGHTHEGYDGNTYCGCCVEDANRAYSPIRSYHYHKGTYEFKDNGEVLPQKFRGFELEIETNGLNLELFEILENYDSEFAFEEDGSLNNGFEVISNPMSFEYWRNVGFDVLRDLITDLKGVGGVYSWDGGNCGLHVHFSRDEWSSETFRTLIKLIIANPTYFKALSGRDDFGYCRIPNFNDYDLESLYNSERYLAVNFTRETAEFRFFRGTLDTPSIWCSIELCDYLLRYCEHISENGDICDYTLSPRGFEEWLRATTSNADILLGFIARRHRIWNLKQKRIAQRGY